MGAKVIFKDWRIVEGQLDCHDPIELDFERVFGVMEWAEYAIKDQDGIFFLVLASIGDRIGRTYIAKTAKEVMDCIRYWPCQDVYAIYEMNDIVDAHIIAKDYRDECGFKKVIMQKIF
jgi:hypothetical protein